MGGSFKGLSNKKVNHKKIFLASDFGHVKEIALLVDRLLSHEFPFYVLKYPISFLII